MSMLKGLTFTTAPRAANLIPSEEYRRNKLIANLQEQRDIAIADAEGRDHKVMRRRWEITETGEKKQVEAPKRLRRWWTKDADGKVVLVVRWGSRLLELQGEKTAIVIGDNTKLVPVFDKIIGAVRAGELDAAIDNANKGRARSTGK
ncbi:DUF6641 family protein [Reyranella sp.]|uniref:DUF6641 family protein n=1 Tax=Reyranella sp. TaxID=1929291 RepID=UPI0027263151|nr:DUF6641 family protein [Reyranella sp.]MDO8973818.1 hypothetical protein [Reyranella sp.]